MSYDLCVTREPYDDLPRDEHGWLIGSLDHGGVCGHPGDCPGACFHYTYNLSAFFSAYRVNPVRDLDGLDARQCARRIETALDAIRKEDPGRLSAEYDPPNGFGSVAGALAWLNRVRAYCAEHPGFHVAERS